MFSKLKKKYHETDTKVKGFIILIILLLSGILLRWEYVYSEIIRGFEFFSK